MGITDVLKGLGAGKSVGTEMTECIHMEATDKTESIVVLYPLHMPLEYTCTTQEKPEQLPYINTTAIYSNITTSEVHRNFKVVEMEKKIYKTQQIRISYKVFTSLVILYFLLKKQTNIVKCI